MTDKTHEAQAWMHPDGRVVPAKTMDGARKDGGAILSSLREYTIPLYTAPTDGVRRGMEMAAAFVEAFIGDTVTADAIRREAAALFAESDARERAVGDAERWRAVMANPAARRALCGSEDPGVLIREIDAVMLTKAEKQR